MVSRGQVQATSRTKTRLAAQPSTTSWTVHFQQRGIRCMPRRLLPYDEDLDHLTRHRHLLVRFSLISEGAAGSSPVSSLTLEWMTTSASLWIRPLLSSLFGWCFHKRHTSRDFGVGLHASQFHLVIVSNPRRTILQMSTILLALSVLPRS